MDIGSWKFTEQSASNPEVGKQQGRVFVRLEEVTWESSRQGKSKLRFEHSKTYRIWETYIWKWEHIKIVGNNGSLERRHSKVVGTLVADTGFGWKRTRHK